MKKADEKIRMIECMEFIAEHINDETVQTWWRIEFAGFVPAKEGAEVPEEVGRYTLSDDEFSRLMGCFLRKMAKADEFGGLACGGVHSK